MSHDEPQQDPAPALGARLRLILATLGATVLAVACQKENV